MFTRAGFNDNARPTGIQAFTMNVRGNRGGWKPAQLWRHESGDLFWHGRGFVAWGHCVQIATLIDTKLGHHMCKRLAPGWHLPGCDLDGPRQEAML